MPAKKKASPREGASHGKENGIDAEQAGASSKGTSSAGPNFAICRTQILKKYWELANLDPETTKGNITGQLKALDSLCQGLDTGRSESAEPDNEQQEEREIYRSAWMRLDKTTRRTSNG